ncbi:MAG: glycosyltransferase, partial [Clostridia bacterium]|nr:glycosyltransferase [Clostridia bacterium]
MISKNKIAIAILLILMFIFYISFPIMVMPDSITYYGHINILNGEQSVAHWNVLRGASLSIVLYIITLIFGNSQFGLLLGTFLFYLITIFGGYYILKKLHIENIKVRKVINIIYLLVIVFNLILISYMHGLLTEFVAIPSILIASLLSLKWIRTNKKISSIVLSIALILGTIFMWFLKQPYVFLFFAPLLVSSVISIFENKKIKNIIYRILVCLLCVMGVLVSNILWNNILIKNGAVVNTGRDTSSIMNSTFINGNTSFAIDFYEDHYNLDYIMNSDLIKESDKQEIAKIHMDQSEYKSYKLVNVFNNFRSREETNIKEKMVLFSTSENHTLSESLRFYKGMVIKYPSKTLKSYIINYLAISDVVACARHKDANVYYPSLTNPLALENHTIGFSIYREDDNFMWLGEDPSTIVKDLRADNPASKIFKEVETTLFVPYQFLYSITLLSLPFFSILILIRRRKVKIDKYKAVYNLGIILLWSSLIHVLFHVFTGAIIDRYAFVIFPAAILGILIYFFEPVSPKEERKMEKYNNDGNKVLFVIPAYNESGNIEKVIDEIKKDVSYADILVINDSSKDNTKDIVEGLGIQCITMPFNVRYAMAVQTGIKYAYQNDYDYVIQFDADGQHIAKEAEKLLNKMKETSCDIVIGSRFLEKTDYPHSFFRMLGTKIFTFLIELFCDKKITDP